MLTRVEQMVQDLKMRSQDCRRRAEKLIGQAEMYDDISYELEKAIEIDKLQSKKEQTNGKV